jgi:long-chain acyl-CoA synthetase
MNRASAGLTFSTTASAVDDAGRVLTMADIQGEASRWRDEIGDSKLLVVLLADNTVPSLRAYLGLVAAGHAVFVAPPDSSREAVANILERFSPAALIGGEDEISVRERSERRTPVHPDVAVLLSTSGSTGSPKLVKFSWPQMMANAEAIVEYLNITADDRGFLHLPFYYSYGLSVVHSQFCAGARLLLTRHSIMTSEFWRRLSTERATSMCGVPFHYETLLRLSFERRNLPDLRTLTQAGGRLASASVEKMARISEEKGYRFFVMYGQTEAGPRISYVPPDQVLSHLDCIGVPIPGVRISLRDDEGGEVNSPDVAGELVVNSPSVMMGYALNASDLALGDECRGLLATGDIAMRGEDGFFRIIGRKSRFIKLHGVRVGLDDIEQRFSSLGNRVTCVGEDDLVVIVVDGQTSLESIRATALEQFSFPASALKVARAQVPVTAAGKPIYDQLLRMFKAS